ncbi:energy-coupling factor transporter transmembrane component T family protein [Microbacterium sp. SA39]|uniref:energy-coupling factor transporter transmembrane component T family protein n=1 Tax=Microbacterium sp. SA39 TaxID=1263625 RepID=UPI0005F9FD8E|nr:energy-coupling factor transporter transmembrane protein EcfT [Microbacterium sp. SA39]KJQ55583.1 Energy-coupling factor transporter transmembrane protein BioN [Microbacterium sp. SA39]
MIQLYRPGTSILHRASPGVKLGCLAAVALVLSMYPHDALSIGIVLLAVACLYLVGGLGVRVLAVELWRLRAIIVVLGAALAVFVSPVAAWINTGRVVALLLLASLLTLTTRMAALLDVLRRLLHPLRRVGIDPEVVAMTFSLTLTMIPVIAGFAARVREAGLARGVRLGPRAVVPLLVMTLRHADDVGEALTARGIV